MQTFSQQIFRQICAAFNVMISSPIEQFTEQTYVNGSTKFFMIKTYILWKEIIISYDILNVVKNTKVANIVLLTAARSESKK